MEREQVLDRLRTAAPFRDLDRAELDAVARSGNVDEVATGELILVAGDPDDEMLVVLSGEAEILAEDRDDVLAGVLAGGVIGEVALLREGKRMVRVRASAPTAVFRWRRASFEDLLGAGDPVGYKVALSIARDLTGHVCRMQGGLDNPCRCGVASARTGDPPHLRDVPVTQWGL